MVHTGLGELVGPETVRIHDFRLEASVVVLQHVSDGICVDPGHCGSPVDGQRCRQVSLG